MRNWSPEELPILEDAQISLHLLSDVSDWIAPRPLEMWDIPYLHYHTLFEFGYCVRGSGVCKVGREEVPFQPGDVEIVYPYQLHLSRAHRGAPCLWHWVFLDLPALMMDAGYPPLPPFADDRNSGVAHSGLFPAAEYPRLTETVRRLVDEVILRPPDWLPMTASLANMLAVETRRIAPAGNRPPDRRDEDMQCIAPALRILLQDARLGRRTGLNALAEQCGMSLSSFQRAFRRVLDASPHDYAVGCALHQARLLLLQTQRSIAQISQDTGFESVSGFNRSFLKHCGQTPSQYRRSNRMSSVLPSEE